MCLLITSRTDEHLILGMNRDDTPSRTHTSYNCNERIAYPIDESSGGTWIGTHASGRLLALLNGHGETPKNPVSRGIIIPEMLRKEITLDSLPLSRYPGFSLFEYSHPHKEITVWQWDGITLDRKKNTLETNILTSSSYGKAGKRKKIAEELMSSGKKTIKEILTSHYPQKSILSLCMHGPRSETIASSIITISKRNLEFYCIKGNPCKNETYEKIVSWEF